MAERGVAAEIQRARILDAMVHVVCERGFAHTTVARVCAHAKVGRSAFYEAFGDLRDCFVAVMDEGHRRAQALMSQAFAQERSWQDGVRAALASLLALFDAEPQLARVWLVETLAAGAWALERRERHVAALTKTIVERWPVPKDAQLSPLAATGVMESVLGIVRAHLLEASGEPVMVLLGPLMGLIATPYVSPSSAASEAERGEALARSILERDAREQRDCPREGQIPKALSNPRARRARECLLYLAEHPGVSNRRIAGAVGISQKGQVSALLTRLQALGLLVKHPGRPGHPNAWWLTPDGERVTRSLCAMLNRAGGPSVVDLAR